MKIHKIKYDAKSNFMSMRPAQGSSKLAEITV